MLELPPEPEPEPELELDAFNKLGRNGGVGRRQLMVQLAVKDLMSLYWKSLGICAIHLPFVLPFLALGAADVAAAAVVAAAAAAATAA